MFFSVLFYCIRRGGKGFTEVRFVLQFGTFCFEPLEHFVLRIIKRIEFVVNACRINICLNGKNQHLRTCV